MTQLIYQVDAFTEQPFTGNPAGVCLLPEPAQADWMQNIAREMNLSETAFLIRQADGFDLRWFTPAAEVRLCGHATLASAHILWQTGVLRPAEQARFHTLSGLLTASQRSAWIEMDFPARPARPVQPPAGLIEALGVAAKFVGRDADDYLVEVESEAIVRSLKPNISALAKLEVRGTIVTARASDPKFDFVSRFFAPAVGVNEDPVTGSSHCCLTPYWADKLGKNEMTAYQASARGGSLRVRLTGARVLLSGQAVTTMKCELLS
ncbi:MAG: PhzF family phenazine biosynthesis protein [Anaerolineales bacterium]